MKFVLFTHPPFMLSQSMPRFASALKDALESAGHSVEIWTASPLAHKLFKESRLEKWAGYIDQYLFFPRQVKARLKKLQEPAFFVFCDQALGPWVPLVKDWPHVIHTHDLLALKSALGLIPENPTSFTGKIYQRYIRKGFQKGLRFIAISSKTKEDLIKFGGISEQKISVVLNELNFDYQRMSTHQAAEVLRRHGLPCPERGMLLHVGGSQWYKNKLGIIKIYTAYAARNSEPLPLWLVGPKPTGVVADAIQSLPAGAKVEFFQGLDNETLQAAYSIARVFLFPSLAEGFGWPIVEAQACGCPVLTTGEPPMNEVGGPNAAYIPRLNSGLNADTWAKQGADAIEQFLRLDEHELNALRERCINWADRFRPGSAFKGYLQTYQEVMAAHDKADHS